MSHNKPKPTFTAGTRRPVVASASGGTSQELGFAKRPQTTHPAASPEVKSKPRALVSAGTPDEQNPRTTPTEVEKDSRYVHVDLPSGCFFYTFDSLSVKLVTAAEQAKFNRAHNERKLRHLVDAISATLEPGKSAYDLTLPDFNWLLYWHRLNGYSKMPYRHRVMCSNEEHHAKVMSGELDEKSLLIEEILNKTSLSETHFEPATYSETVIRNIVCQPATMRDSVEIDDMPDNDDKGELLWLADLAAYLGHGLPFAQRLALVKDFSPDEVEELRQYAESVSDYGVVEQITLKCKGCGAFTTSSVVVDALSFLPSSR